MSWDRFVKLIVASALGLIIALAVWISEITIGGNTAVSYIDTYFGNLNTEAISYLSSLEYDGYKFKGMQEGQAEIIISMYDTDHRGCNIVGYSPIVAIFPNKIMDNEDANFRVEVSSSNINYNNYLVDMDKVIKAFAESDDGKISASALGFKSKEDSIGLAIPDKSNFYRQDAVNAIIYCLTGGQQVDETNIEYVKSSLNKILKNAVNVANISGYQLDTGNTILLIPECLVNTSGGIPVYWNNCYASKICMRFKGEVKDDTGDTTDSEEGVELTDVISSEVYDNIVYLISNDYSLLSKARIRNSREGVKAPSFYFIDRIKTINGQDNLEEILGKGYYD